MASIIDGEQWIVSFDFDDPNLPAAEPDPQWGGPPDGYFADKYEWPRRSLSSEGLTNGVRVSTEALQTFATNLRSMIGPLTSVKDKLEDVKLAPGGFYDAYELTMRVLGAGAGQAIQPTTLEFLNRAIQAITCTSEELERLALAYATAEELNAATGRDLGEHIEGAKSYITAAVGGATSVP